MTIAIIITLSTLLLISYLFDISSRFTRIPSVILLLMLGWSVKQLSGFFEIDIPDMSFVLPVLGMIGLILIVLDGSLELQLNKTKIPIIRKSFFLAFFPIIILSAILSVFFHLQTGASYKDCLANAIPFCVISSAVAISSASMLSPYNREVVVYESSLSDIIGVLFFNFIALNAEINFTSVGWFVVEVIIIAVISFIASILLSVLLSRIEHRIKFAPIVLLVILIYAVSEIYHLPALVFVLLFGLFLGNIDELKHIRFIGTLQVDKLNEEVEKLKDFLTEATFLVRSLFFILFGFMMRTEDVLNVDTLVWSLGIVAVIFIVRALQLRISGFAIFPLIFLAPRGLINILLFLSAVSISPVPEITSSLMIQVIIIVAIIMMFGFIFTKNNKESIAVSS